MRPSTPLLDVVVGWTDEEVLLFLGGKRVGDPIPSNVITEVNPFSVEPWDLSDDIWYLFNSEDSQSQKGEKKIKATREGFWKNMGHDLAIMTGTIIIGTKTIWEFYVGQTPLGNRTGWMMHEYQAEPKVTQGLNSQDYSFLCKVFWQSNENADYEEQVNPKASDNADGEYIESLLLRFLEEEEDNDDDDGENKCYLYDASNNTKEDSSNEQTKFATLGRQPQCSTSTNYAESMQDVDNLSKGDYLELDDLCSIGTSSSISDNSSLISLNSDEYFNADALLKDLEMENPIARTNTTEGHLDSSFNIASSTTSNYLVITPLPSALIENTNNTLVVNECIPSTNIFTNGVIPDHACSASDVELFKQASRSTMSQGSQTNQTLTGSSQESNSSKSSLQMMSSGETFG